MMKPALVAALLCAVWPQAQACPPYAVRVQVMDELMVQHPNTAVLWLRRGEANLMLGQPQVALNDLAKAQRIDPSLSQVAFHQGMALQQLGRHDQAERALSRYLTAPLRALTELPAVKRLLGSGPLDLAGVSTQRDVVSEMITRYQDGELNEMLCGETAFPEAARSMRAQSLRALGRQGEAEAELQRLAREHPGPDYVLEGARLLRSQGRHREALQNLNSALASLGSLSVLEDEALACELKLKEPSDGLRRLERLLAEKPTENRPERLERLGFCLSALGKAGAAKTAYQKARQALAERPLRARESPQGQALSQRIRLAMQ